MVNIGRSVGPLISARQGRMRRLLIEQLAADLAGADASEQAAAAAKKLRISKMH